jgi:hypothetical protein
LSPVEITNSTGVKYNIMPVNLASKYDSDGVHIKNWFYQWGRKDPMLCPSSYNSSTNHNPGKITISSKATYLSQGISGPTKFFYNDGGSKNWFGDKSYYNLWDAACTGPGKSDRDTVKTIYDPCPAGWQVGDADKWLSAGFSSSSYNTTLRGILLKSGDDEIWLPGAGYIDPFQYKIGGIGFNGSIWMANVDEDGTSAMSIGYSDYRGLDDYKSHSRRASGLSVRCQKSIDII